MKRIAFYTIMIFSLSILSSCMSREEAAKYVTIIPIQSPQAHLGDWHAVEVMNANSKRFESPLGRIDISQQPTPFTIISQPQVIAAFQTLKQQTEQQIISSHNMLINPAEDDSLQLAHHDFLHTTYRIRNISNHQRQHIELFLAPINHDLVTIIVQIGDDVDMQSYSELQTFLDQQVSGFNSY